MEGWITRVTLVSSDRSRPVVHPWVLVMELVLNTLARLADGVGKARVAGCRDSLVEGLVGEEVVAVAERYMADEEVTRMAGEGRQGARITEYCWMQQVLACTCTVVHEPDGTISIGNPKDPRGYLIYRVFFFTVPP